MPALVISCKWLAYLAKKTKMCPEPQVGHIQHVREVPLHNSQSFYRKSVVRLLGHTVDKHKVTCRYKIFYFHLGKKTYQEKKRIIRRRKAGRNITARNTAENPITKL
jgi:hypothetical protein